MVAWTFPVEKWRGRTPVVSQSYTPPGHEGVDIMFRRIPTDALEFPIGKSSSKNYVCPADEVGVVAVADGTLVRAGKMENGHYAVIDHGGGIHTLYLHMSRLFVPFTKTADAKHANVRAGERIGLVGFSPLDGQRLPHLHFEVWKGGDASKHVDPAPFLKGARIAGGFARLELVLLLAIAGAALLITNYL